MPSPDCFFIDSRDLYMLLRFYSCKVLHNPPSPADNSNMNTWIVLIFLLAADYGDPSYIANLEKKAANNPSDWQTRLELVELFIDQNNLADAQKNILEVAATATGGGDTCNARLYYLWGKVNDLRDNIAGAMEKYTQAVRCDSTFSDAWRKMGYLHEVFANYEQMLFCFQQALPFTEDRSGLYYDIGVAYDYLDSSSQALNSYYQSLNSGDTIPEALLNLGVDWELLGYPDSAALYFEKAIAADFDNPELYYNMGVMMFDSGVYAEALDNFMRTLALNPYYSPAKLQLGRIYEIMGDSGMARIYFEDFVKTAPILYSDDIEAVKEKLEKYNTAK